MSEHDYMQGSRGAWLTMLQTCLQNLNDDPEAIAARWALERAAAVQALRNLCKDHGDNDWPDDLHLTDVIEKHLGQHLAKESFT